MFLSRISVCRFWLTLLVRKMSWATGGEEWVASVVVSRMGVIDSTGWLTHSVCRSCVSMGTKFGMGSRVAGRNGALFFGSQ